MSHVAVAVTHEIEPILTFLQHLRALLCCNTYLSNPKGDSNAKWREEEEDHSLETAKYRHHK